MKIAAIILIPLILVPCMVLAVLHAATQAIADEFVAAANILADELRR